MSPRVSVITVCFNAQDSIKRTVESVLSQSYPDIEYIIIDGASRDDTFKIIQSYRDRIAILISEPDKGIYDAMNKGIKASSGQVIYFLNANDVFCDDDVIKDAIVMFETFPTTQLLYGDVEIFDYIKGVPLKVQSFVLNSKQRLLKSGFAQQRLFYKREVFDICGYFCNKYRIHGDFEWLLRCFEKRIIMKHLKRSFTRMAAFGASSTNSFARLLEKSRIIKLHFSPIRALFYLLHHYLILLPIIKIGVILRIKR